MKCTELPYKRPDIADICRQYREIAKAISEAADASEQLEQYKKAEALARHTSTQSALATIRHTVDTRDKFYEEENEFWTRTAPPWRTPTRPWRAPWWKARSARSWKKLWAR